MRDFETPQWKALRFACFKRFNFICQLCGAIGVPLVSHHVIRVADNPSLEFKLWNLICVCKVCHDTRITGFEKNFEKQFQEIIRLKKLESAHFKGKKVYGQRKRPYRKRNPFLRF